MRRVTGILLAVLCLFPATALADAQFTADDIIKHFLKGKTAARAEPAPAKTSARTRPGRPQIDEDDDDVLPLTGAKRSVTVGASDGGDPGGLNLLITFESGSDRLTSQARRNLDAFATALSSPALASFAFEVQGHTDAVGSDTANMALSQKRAESVVSYLVGRGIEGNRLRARGFGETQPMMSDPNHPQNRRVVTKRIR